MLASDLKPRRRVSSLQADKHTAFDIGHNDSLSQMPNQGMLARPVLLLFIAFSLIISIILCLIDVFVLTGFQSFKSDPVCRPATLFAIPLFAWFGLPSLGVLCFSMAIVLVRAYSTGISALFGHESLLASQTRHHERFLIISGLLALSEVVVCRFWLSGGLSLLFMNQPEQIWSQSFDITSPQLRQAIELCQILYILIVCWVLLSISVAFIKNMAMTDALANDITDILLNRKILSTICCETERQRTRLFQSWDVPSQINVKDEIDHVRENPLRLPLSATVSNDQVQNWMYSEHESVEVTSLPQMHVLSVKIRDNVLSKSSALTYQRWKLLFNDEEMADQAWSLMFSSLSMADSSHISEHHFSLALVKAYMRHILLQGKICNYDSMFGILKIIAAIAWFFAMVYVIGAVRGENPTFMLVSLLAFLGSVTFAVSSSINYAVVSIVFILFKKPYQVGDRVNINGSDYYVVDINLLSTTFSAIDNRCLIMPNYSLSAMKIYNHQLSSPAVVTWEATLDPEITEHQINQLRLGLIRFARLHADFWKPQITFLLQGLTDGSLKLEIKAYHRLNWQQAGSIAEHQTAIIEEFRHLHLSMGIATGGPEVRHQVLAAIAA